MYNQERMETFSASYTDNLIEACKAHPEKYAIHWAGFGDDAEAYAKSTASKMLAIIAEKGIGAVTINPSDGFKRTCKALGIKQTYKAIEAYLKGE